MNQKQNVCFLFANAFLKDHESIEHTKVHTFHIPVLGLAFSIDTPIRVARFGISSVISIVDDILIEQMRKYYCSLYNEQYNPIESHEHDCRARRITAYLNLVQQLVHDQIVKLKASAFERGSEIVKYFEMLPENSLLKQLYARMAHSYDQDIKATLQATLRNAIVPGDIDVNIMTKLNKTNTGPDRKELPPEYSDALASLRGFARSNLRSSVVLSAGLNPRLFSYLSSCKEFLPDANGQAPKKVTLKVSDYRSALIQGRFLAKKGIWISEYRIESGLNCGGHAFATDGLLLGPILEEFKAKRQCLVAELHTMYGQALRERGLTVPATPRSVRVTVQGGIGTAREDRFLREFHNVDGTGWGSPFLLVPEATNLDDATRKRLADASKGDFYISNASPMGVPFNNIKGSSSEEQTRQRIQDGKPGSPCTKKFLISNTEFTEEPICTASRQYQSLKIKQLRSLDLPSDELSKSVERVTAKSCLCEDLAATALITTQSEESSPQPAVAVCPGPNLAYFSRISSLEEMVGHIYGRTQVFSADDRPNMFINELELYVNYLKEEIKKKIDSFTVREQKYFATFRENMLEGIMYYRSLIPRILEESDQYRAKMREELTKLEEELRQVFIPAART